MYNPIHVNKLKYVTYNSCFSPKYLVDISFCVSVVLISYFCVCVVCVFTCYLAEQLSPILGVASFTFYAPPLQTFLHDSNFHLEFPSVCPVFVIIIVLLLLKRITITSPCLLAPNDTVEVYKWRA